MKKIENFRVKKCLEDGVGSYGSYNTFSGLNSGLSRILIINDMEIRGLNSEDRWNLLDLMLTYGSHDGYGGSCLVD